MSGGTHRDIRPRPAWAERRGTLAASLAIGLGGELIVPWTILGLSNWLFFDLPHWAMWLMFAVPIVLAAMTPLFLRLIGPASVISRGRGHRALHRPAPPP